MQRIKKKIASLLWIVTLVLAVGLAQAVAADYPTRPITLVIPLAAGGAVDLVGRSLAQAAKPFLEQPIICENKAGGGASVGFTLAVNKPPDGYTIVIPTSHSLKAAYHMGLLAHNPNQVTHIIRVSGILNGMVVRADSPWKTAQEFIQYAKKNPNKISYGTGGVGHPPHLGMEELAIAEGGIKWTHIPYKGVSEANTALLGGHVEAVCGGSAWAPLVDAGKLRLLAVFTPGRSARYPQVPTFRDLGYEIAYASPIDIMGPKGMPQPVVKKLHDAFKKAMNDPDLQSAMKKFDMFPIYLSSEDLQKINQQEFEQVGKMVQKLGLQKKQ